MRLLHATQLTFTCSKLIIETLEIYSELITISFFLIKIKHLLDASTIFKQFYTTPVTDY